MPDKYQQHPVIHNNAPYHADSIDTIGARAAQLNAILIMITGEGFNNFQSYNSEIQENVLWACSDLASDIEWHCANPDQHQPEESKGVRPWQE